MKRALACLCLLTLTACGSSHARVSESATPTANVLVYAKNPGRDQLGGKQNVWKADIGGRHPTLLAKDSTDPTVSPDGRAIAYDNGGNVLVIPTAGGKPKIVYRYGGYPIWAPDSRHIAVSGGIGWLVIINVRTGDKTAFAAPPSNGIDSISFSPDSTRVVYGAESSTGGNLYVASIHGGQPMQITHDGQSFAPVWGQKGIAFLRNNHGPAGDIWLTGPRPNDARQLTHNGAALGPVSFSEDGAKLLAGGDSRLWAIDIPSGRIRSITPRPTDINPQGLSADGKTILAVVGCGGDYGGPHHGVIETIPFAGGKPHILTRGPCGASWSAGY